MSFVHGGQALRTTTFTCGQFLDRAPRQSLPQVKRELQARIRSVPLVTGLIGPVSQQPLLPLLFVERPHLEDSLWCEQRSRPSPLTLHSDGQAVDA
jgi:hypothetical protein